MIEYINRERVRRAIRKVVACVTCPSHIAANIYQALDSIPDEDAVPVVHGHWIEEENGVIVCSECGEEHEWQDYRATYCEDCGAKMDGGNKNA